MLTLFPTLLSWNQFSPFIIRLALGAVFVYWAWLRLKQSEATTGSRILGIADAVLGIALVVGFWTQVAATLVALDLIWRIIKKGTEKALFTSGVNYYVVLLVLALSLLVTGAGWWGFDLAI